MSLSVYHFFVLPSFKTFWIDVVFSGAWDSRLGWDNSLFLIRIVVVVTVHLLVPVLIFPFVMENFFRERRKPTRKRSYIQDAEHILRDSISIWVLICCRPCRRRLGLWSPCIRKDSHRLNESRFLSCLWRKDLAMIGTTGVPLSQTIWSDIFFFLSVFKPLTLSDLLHRHWKRPRGSTVRTCEDATKRRCFGPLGPWGLRLRFGGPFLLRVVKLPGTFTQTASLS